MTGPKAIIAAVAAVTGTIALAALLWSFAGFTRIEAVIATVTLLVGSALVLTVVARQREHSETTAEILQVKKVTTKLARDVISVQQRMDDLEAAVEKRARTHTEQISAEMQILETLVKQLAEGVARGGVAGQGIGVRSARQAGANRRPEVAADEDDAGMLETVRRSLEDNRVDLYLQPIVTLPQRRTIYYEGLTRLRDGDGKVIMPSSYLPVAESAGMMPTIDNLLLFRCVNVVRRLVERSREAGVFCNISAHSLLDAEFFPQFIEYLKANPDLSDMLIFEFPQRMVSVFGPMERESLAALTELGYRFSIDNVRQLDMDYAALADSNFQFVKVDADILLYRMEEAGAQIHAADLRELLHRNGIELIAEKIESERALVNLLDFDVSLAQGYLFGEPKLVRGDADARELAGLARTG